MNIVLSSEKIYGIAQDVGNDLISQRLWTWYQPHPNAWFSGSDVSECIMPSNIKPPLSLTCGQH